MVGNQVGDRSKLRKAWMEQAIALAMQSKWDEAVQINQNILEMFPRDVDALNRLGRALTELGHYARARNSYARAVELDPNNTIAQKNLIRLSSVKVEEAPAEARERVDLNLFIAETGKTGVGALMRPDREALLKMAVGDRVDLVAEGRALMVRNARGDHLGQVEPKISQRLIDLMEGGNQYAAAIMSLDENGARIIIRETVQHPSLVGKVSFPSRGPDAAAIRPYIKDSILRYDAEEDDDYDDSDYGPDGDEQQPEEQPDITEFEEDRTQE